MKTKIILARMLPNRERESCSHGQRHLEPFDRPGSFCAVVVSSPVSLVGGVGAACWSYHPAASSASLVSAVRPSHRPAELTESMLNESYEYRLTESSE